MKTLSSKDLLPMLERGEMKLEPAVLRHSMLPTKYGRIFLAYTLGIAAAYAIALGENT